MGDRGAPKAVLKVRVQPGASRTELAAFRDGQLWIRLAAPPVEGRANDALIELLAEALGVKKRDIAITRGFKSRIKEVTLEGLSQEEALGRLQHLLSSSLG